MLVMVPVLCFSVHIHSLKDVLDPDHQIDLCIY